MNMAVRGPNKRLRIASWVLRIILGLLFLEIGITKLTGTAHTVDWFAAIGWGQWFRYVTGFFDVAGTALLFLPRCARYGATVIACSVGTGTVISFTVLRHDPVWGSPAMRLVPLILTILAIGLAWLTRPASSAASELVATAQPPE
jgi:putative oxidoreductase